MSKVQLPRIDTSTAVESPVASLYNLATDGTRRAYMTAVRPQCLSGLRSITGTVVRVKGGCFRSGSSVRARVSGVSATGINMQYVWSGSIEDSSTLLFTLTTDMIPGRYHVTVEYNGVPLNLDAFKPSKAPSLLFLVYGPLLLNRIAPPIVSSVGGCELALSLEVMSPDLTNSIPLKDFKIEDHGQIKVRFVVRQSDRALRLMQHLFPVSYAEQLNASSGTGHGSDWIIGTQHGELGADGTIRCYTPRFPNVEAYRYTASEPVEVLVALDGTFFDSLSNPADLDEWRRMYREREQNKELPISPRFGSTNAMKSSKFQPRPPASGSTVLRSVLHMVPPSPREKRLRSPGMASMRGGGSFMSTASAAFSFTHSFVSHADSTKPPVEMSGDPVYLTACRAIEVASISTPCGPLLGGTHVSVKFKTGVVDVNGGKFLVKLEAVPLPLPEAPQHFRFRPGILTGADDSEELVNAVPLSSLSDLDALAIGNLHDLSFEDMAKRCAQGAAASSTSRDVAIVVGTAVHWDNKMVDEIEFVTPSWPLPPSHAARQRITVALSVSMNGHEFSPVVPRVTEFLYYKQPEVLEVTPNRAACEGGTAIQIYGRNFNAFLLSTQDPIQQQPHFPPSPRTSAMEFQALPSITPRSSASTRWTPRSLASRTTTRTAASAGKKNKALEEEDPVLATLRSLGVAVQEDTSEGRSPSSLASSAAAKANAPGLDLAELEAHWDAVTYTWRDDDLLRSHYREAEWEAAYRARAPLSAEEGGGVGGETEEEQTQRLLAIAETQRRRAASMDSAAVERQRVSDGAESNEISASWSNARGVMVAFSNGDSTKFVRASVNEDGVITCKTPHFVRGYCAVEVSLNGVDFTGDWDEYGDCISERKPLFFYPEPVLIQASTTQLPCHGGLVILEARNMEHYRHPSIQVVLHTFTPAAFGIAAHEHSRDCQFSEQETKEQTGFPQTNRRNTSPLRSSKRSLHGTTRQRRSSERSIQGSIHACSCLRLNGAVDASTITVSCPAAAAPHPVYLSLLPVGLGAKHVPQLLRQWKQQGNGEDAEVSNILSGVEDGWSIISEDEEEEDDTVAENKDDDSNLLGSSVRPAPYTWVPDQRPGKTVGTFVRVQYVNPIDVVVVTPSEGSVRVSHKLSVVWKGSILPHQLSTTRYRLMSRTPTFDVTVLSEGLVRNLQRCRTPSRSSSRNASDSVPMSAIEASTTRVAADVGEDDLFEGTILFPPLSSQHMDQFWFEVAFDGVNFGPSASFRRHYHVYDIPFATYIEPSLLPPIRGTFFRLTVNGMARFPNLLVRCWYINPNLPRLSSDSAEPHAIVYTRRPTALSESHVIVPVPEASPRELTWLTQWWSSDASSMPLAHTTYSSHALATLGFQTITHLQHWPGQAVTDETTPSRRHSISPLKAAHVLQSRKQKRNIWRTTALSLQQARHREATTLDYVHSGLQLPLPQGYTRCSGDDKPKMQDQHTPREAWSVVYPASAASAAASTACFLDTGVRVIVQLLPEGLPDLPNGETRAVDASILALLDQDSLRSDIAALLRKPKFEATLQRIIDGASRQGQGPRQLYQATTKTRYFSTAYTEEDVIARDCCDYIHSLLTRQSAVTSRYDVKSLLSVLYPDLQSHLIPMCRLTVPLCSCLPLAVPFTSIFPATLSVQGGTVACVLARHSLGKALYELGCRRVSVRLDVVRNDLWLARRWAKRRNMVPPSQGENVPFPLSPKEKALLQATALSTLPLHTAKPPFHSLVLPALLHWWKGKYAVASFITPNLPGACAMRVSVSFNGTDFMALPGDVACVSPKK